MAFFIDLGHRIWELMKIIFQKLKHFFIYCIHLLFRLWPFKKKAKEGEGSSKEGEGPKDSPETKAPEDVPLEESSPEEAPETAK